MAEENATSVIEGSGTPSGAESETKDNVQADGGASGEGATDQKSFIPKDVDINTLPPTLRAVVDKINKEMVRGFTASRMKDSEMTKAEIAKAREEFKAKADFYDQFTKHEKLVKFYNDYANELSGQKQGQEVDKNGDPVIQELKSEVEQMKQERLEAKLSSVIDGFADAVDEKGEPVAPHFEKFNSLVIGQTQGRDGKPEEFSLLRATTQLAPGNTPEEKLANGYKMAEKVYNSILDEGKKMSMERVQAKVRNSNLAPGGSSTISGVQIVEKKNLNAHEALKLARQGKLVSRE